MATQKRIKNLKKELLSMIESNPHNVKFYDFGKSKAERSLVIKTAMKRYYKKYWQHCATIADFERNFKVYSIDGKVQITD